MCAYGNKMALCSYNDYDNGYICTSIDSGSNWTQVTNLGVKLWRPFYSSYKSNVRALASFAST